MTETLQISQLITNIIIIILFVGLAVLVFKLMNLVKAAQDQVKQLTGRVDNVIADVKPVIEKVSGIASTVQSITAKVNNDIEVVNDVVHKLKDTVEDVIEFEQRIKRQIEPPIHNTITTYSAIIKGVMAFVNKFRGHTRSSDDIDYDEYASPEIKETKQDLENEFMDDFEDINRELNEVRDKLDQLRK